jgi:hypothetical protein
MLGAALRLLYRRAEDGGRLGLFLEKIFRRDLNLLAYRPVAGAYRRSRPSAPLPAP